MSIQIQLLLKLNDFATSTTLPQSHIQIQLLLKLNPLYKAKLTADI